MIIGTGTDLCDISRIEKTLEKFGVRFINRLYSKREQARAERKPNKRADRYAQMFAAKEACSKALGTGFREGVYWSNMEVISLPSGKPTLELSGGAKSKMNSLIPANMVGQVDISLTDESGLAHAMVIISANPKN